MDILFVATVYNHLAAFHKPFIRYFQEKGYTVHVAGSDSMGRKDELISLGVISHDINFNKSILSKDNRVALRELDELFNTLNFDLIHVHTPIAALLVRFALRKKESQGSLLYTAHGFHYYKGASFKKWLLFYNAEKIARHWTDGILVMNNEDVELAKKMGYKEGQNLFFVNGVGVDLKEFSDKSVQGGSIREELKLQPDNIVISCVAELSARKNQMFLLENWLNVFNENNNVHLLFIGEGQDSKKLKHYVQKEGLENIHFMGFRRDMPKILAETDIVTLVSKHEGLPRCIMEALVLGKPIIATDVRGSRDLVQDGHNGFLVDLQDSKLLVQKFKSLIESEDLRKKFGQHSKNNSQKYDLNYVLKQMDQVYSKYLI